MTWYLCTNCKRTWLIPFTNQSTEPQKQPVRVTSCVNCRSVNNNEHQQQQEENDKTRKNDL